MVLSKDDILKNYELLKKDGDRYNSNAFEIRKLASQWFLVVAGAISYLLIQHKDETNIQLALPEKIIQLPIPIIESINTTQLVGIVAFFGLIGTSTLAMLDIYLYHQLLKATIKISIGIEEKYNVVLPIRNNVLYELKSRWWLLTLASILFYVIPMLLLTVVMYCFSWGYAIVSLIYLIILGIGFIMLPLPSISRTLTTQKLSLPDIEEIAFFKELILSYSNLKYGSISDPTKEKIELLSDAKLYELSNMLLNFKSQSDVESWLDENIDP